MADRHVRFTVPPSGQPTITVDEVDISNRVSHITIDMAARDTRPDIEVTLAARSLDVFAGRANVHVDETTRAALVALGWTPPPLTARELGLTGEPRIADDPQPNSVAGAVLRTAIRHGGL